MIVAPRVCRARYPLSFLLFLLVLAWPVVTGAATFTVNANDDVTSGECDRTHCTLPEAIAAANERPGLDTIVFNIGGGGAVTIAVEGGFGVEDPVIIDGTTQPGFAGSPIVELRGLHLLLGPGSDGSTIRGLVINGITSSGIDIYESNGNLIEGNYIGIDVTGTVAIPNDGSGVVVYAGSKNNTVGGTTAAARNVISGNRIAGVRFEGSESTGNVAIGNFIGTNAAGTAAIPNDMGVLISFGANGNRIGGAATGEGNVISGNERGISFQTEAHGNLVQGNFIGTDPTGATMIPNREGVQIFADAHDNTIGGPGAGAGNRIVGSELYGISVNGSTVTGNAIRGNSIYQNGQLGIDLDTDGPTPNDDGDADTGANLRQNYPVLSRFVDRGGSLEIIGELESAPSTSFAIDFFGNAECHRFGFGEGQVYLGSASVTTDAEGHSAIEVTLAGGATSFVTATATDPAGNTSEFSACADPVAVRVDPASELTTTESGGTAEFTLVLVARPSADVTIDLTSTDPGEGTVFPASLEFTVDNWNVPQQVTVTGVDDNSADQDQPYTIMLTLTSTDSGYGGLMVPDIVLTNLDDETSEADRDGDGIPGATEDTGPNSGDGNGDGIADSMQTGVASFPLADGSGFVTVVSNCELRYLGALSKSDRPPAPRILSHGLVRFGAACATAELTFLYHGMESWSTTVGFARYGPVTPGDAATTGWYLLPDAVFDTTTVGSATVARARLTLTDGIAGDDTAVDGEIRGAGGPGEPGRERSIRRPQP